LALALAGLVALGGAGIAGLHVGVEAGLWPSPLPECAAPRFSGGSIAERLASMPARPAKPCDEPVYIVPALPVSLAAMNLLASLAFSAGVAGFLWRSRRSLA
jgi:disulfide bond formation protein DsbB